MTCQSSSVAITPASASEVASPACSRRRQLRGVRRPDRRSRTASATIAVSTDSPPRASTARLSIVGETMNRVSTSMRADNPGCAGTFRSVKIPPTCGFFSGASVPAAPGIPTKSAPATRVSAQMCSTLQAPAAYRRAGRHRGNRVAERDDDRVLVGPDEQPGFAGLEAVDGQRRKHQAAVGGQRGDRRAGDGDVQRSRRPGHQRRGDVGHMPVGQALRPQDRRGGLFDREQRDQGAQQCPGDARDDGDPTARAGASIAHCRRGARGTMVGDCVRPATMQPAWRAEQRPTIRIRPLCDLNSARWTTVQVRAPVARIRSGRGARRTFQGGSTPAPKHGLVGQRWCI